MKSAPKLQPILPALWLLLLVSAVTGLFAGCVSPNHGRVDYLIKTAVQARSSAKRQQALMALVQRGREVSCPEDIWYRVANTNDCTDTCDVSGLWSLRAPHLFQLDDVHYIHFGLRRWLGDAPDPEHPFCLSLLHLVRYPSKWKRFSIVVQELITDEQARELNLPAKSKFEDGLHDYKTTGP